jgi:hypothetical protein
MRAGATFGLLWVVLALSVNGCRQDEPGAEPRATGLGVRLRLSSARGEEVQAFRRGERITLQLTLHNRGDALQRLSLSSARTHDVVISTPEGEELWRWSHGRLFAQMLTEMTLQPGASRAFSSTWDQTRADGGAVAEGRYQAVGLIPAMGSEIRSQPVSFTIE